MPAEDKGDLQKNPKQMHLLSAKKGSGNESSCSFRPPVFFQWRKDETASSGFFFFFFHQEQDVCANAVMAGRFI